MAKLAIVGALAGGAALLGGCALRSVGPPLVVSVAGDDAGCRVIVDGEQVSSDRLLEIGRSSGHRRAIVVHDDKTPYKCIGGAIFTLQSAGVTSVDAAGWSGNQHR